MEATLREVCGLHRLTTISVMLQFSRYDSITVYLHWSDGDDDGGENDRCVSGYGKTFDEALSMGLSEMSRVRPAVDAALSKINEAA